jgi:hypothetical protein
LISADASQTAAIVLGILIPIVVIILAIATFFLIKRFVPFAKTCQAAGSEMNESNKGEHNRQALKIKSIFSRINQEGESGSLSTCSKPIPFKEFVYRMEEHAQNNYSELSDDFKVTYRLLHAVLPFGLLIQCLYRAYS